VHLPKKIDSAVKERALRMFAYHRQDNPSDTALAEAVAKQSVWSGDGATVAGADRR